MRVLVWLAVAAAGVGGVSCVGGEAVIASSGGPSGAGRLETSGSDLVAGGELSSGNQYGAVLTLGQAPGGNGVTTSPRYRFQGGLVGATQAR